jgi:hypothetical protein
MSHCVTGAYPHRAMRRTLVSALLMSVLAMHPGAAANRKPSAAKPAPHGASLPALEPFPELSTNKTELVVGNLRATIAAKDQGAILPVGTAAFATLSITATGGAKSVTVFAEGNGGRIRSITGTSVHTTAVRDGLLGEVPLPAQGNASVTVEMETLTGSKGLDGKPRSQMRLTLLPASGGRDESILSWALSDCAGDYHAELQKIHADRHEHMMQTLDAVASRETGYPATWIFPPPKTAPHKLAADCRSAKGKSKESCPKPDDPTADLAAAMAKKEASILDLANLLRQNGGALPGFQRRQQVPRLVSYAMLSGLRIYMEQKPHPALCSGVEPMADYYLKRTALLRRTIDEARAARRDAAQLAREKTESVAPAGPSSPASPPPGEASGLIERIAGVVLRQEAAGALAGDVDAMAKLQHLRTLIAAMPAADLPDDRRAAVTAALRMIEASLYLDIAAEKYSRLDDMIYGTLDAITSAHKQRCTCAP